MRRGGHFSRGEGVKRPWFSGGSTEIMEFTRATARMPERKYREDRIF